MSRSSTAEQLIHQAKAAMVMATTNDMRTEAEFNFDFMRRRVGMETTLRGLGIDADELYHDMCEY